MMLHRHFEEDKANRLTRLSDVTPGEKKEEFVSSVFPPDAEGEQTTDEPKRRGRPKRTDTD